MSAYCMDCGVQAVWERGPGTPLVIRHSVDCPNVTSKPPSSPVETTDADECAHTALSLIYRRERDEARDEIERLWAALTNLRTEIRLLTIGPAHQHHAGKITPSQLCDLLERTEAKP